MQVKKLMKMNDAVVSYLWAMNLKNLSKLAA